MDDKARRLLEEALHLPVKERAHLAVELSASVERDDELGEVEKAWAEEIKSWVQRVNSGESKLSDWARVRERIQREYLGS